MSLSGLKVDPGVLAGLAPGEREAVRDELRVLEEEFAKNPLLGYRPHGKQRVFHAPPHPPLRAFFGGNRSGKSTATMVDTIVQCVDREIVPEHLLPIKRWEPPTNTLEGVVLQKIREWCPRSQLKGGGFDRAWDKQQRVLHFRNESWIQFFSNDQDLDKFGGAALHRVVFDEEPREDLRRECLMRLIDYGGEELYGCTPLHGMNWIFDEIYEPWERGELSPEDGRVVVVDMDDNPHLNRETMARVLSGLSEEERQARKSGRFVAFAGLIYPQFSKVRHVIPELPGWADEKGREWFAPPGVEVFCGVDPGIRHMCAVLWAYLDGDDRLVVFDEIAAQGQTIKEICVEVGRRNERWAVRPRWYVIDPAARNKNNQTGRSDQQEFMDNGVVTIPGQNAVGAGINRVKERLDADRLVVTANCVELVQEFKKYRWVKNSRNEDEPAQRPVKKDDHLLDALRYVVAQRPLMPEYERRDTSTTMKDRLLRHSLRQLTRIGKAPAAHDSGPGIWA